MKVLGFGAILWDDIKDDDENLNSDSIIGEQNIGGAVFNVIVHMQKLGYDAHMLSAIGDDKLGEKTFKEIDCLQVSKKFINKVKSPTCIIQVRFDQKGFPHYSSPETVSWDQIKLDAHQIIEIDELKFDFFVFGTLEQRNSISRKTLHTVLEKVHFKYVYIDLTLRGNFYSKEVLDYSMRKSNIVKMNDDEALVVNKLFDFRQTDFKQLIPIIAREFDNDVVCVTLGEKGACIGDKSFVIYKPAYNIEVKDTVGSGDGFSAGLLYMLGKGASLDEACDFSNKMGALISSKKSSIPDYDFCELENMKLV